MQTHEIDRVAPASYVTLHYRLSLDDGTTLVSTFDGNPATFQLGAGQLAEPLERCMIGLSVGERAEFALEPDRAFGPRNDELVQRARRSDMPPGIDLAPGQSIELQLPGGQPLSARVIEADAVGVTLDFNHPLAGRAVRFEVQIIGVL